MNAFPTDAHLHITVEPRLTRHLSQTIQTVELLELNAEGLYEYLAQAAEANPMMLVQRTPLPELPLHARCEGFDVGDLGMHDEQELGAYLRRQLAFLKLRKEKARIAAYLVESLDENGFFREDCASAARELGVSEAAVKDALEAVQSLEPAGIGARSLQECLLLQLRRLPQRNALAERIVGMHWELFLRRPRAGMLADFLDMPQEKAEQALALIADLNPRPANGFSHDDPQYVIPDAYLINGEDGLHVQLVDSCTLTIDESYPSLFADTDDAQVRQFLSQCAHQADRLQSRLFYRNALLQKILLVAAQQQAAYFVGGEKKPLRQKDVAALLGVNVSTISRAIQGKYISVDGRCIRVRELFSRPSAGNRARSTHSIQQQILALIEAEDPQRPLSDQKIHEQLAQSGVAVSRRLIAKYRALAQIPSAYARKITRESTGRNVVSAGGEKE